MKWAAIETEDGEARVLDTETDRVVARIVSEPFEGMAIANLIAAAPDLAVTAHEYIQKEER